MRLPLLTQLDMPQGMCPSIEDHSLDLPRRLGRLSGGPSLRLRHPGDALNLRLLLLRRSFLKPSSWTRFTAQKKSPDPPRGFFGGRSLSSLCGLVGFRGVAPHHRPIHPEHFHQRFHMDRFPMGRIYYQLRVLCFGLTTATHVFTRLMAPMSTILHRYVVGMLRYLDDWLILAESRTTGIQARDRLLQVCAELGLQVNFRKSSLIPSQDMTSLGMQIQSVRFFTKPTATWVGNFQDLRGVSFIPGPPSSSLASSSGPPFVPYSSGKGWDVTDAISPDSPQVQVGLSRRVTSHPLGSSVSGGPFMVVLGDSTTRGRRSFSPSARLELLLERVRRRLGRHRRGKPSVRSLDSKPKGTLHQPQGDDGTAKRPLRVQLSSQRQDDRSLLRQCHDSRLPQAIGRHEVSGPVPQSEGDSPVGRIHEDHATSPVHPGVSQHESGSSKSAQPSDRVGMDATPGGTPGSSSPVAGDHSQASQCSLLQRGNPRQRE